MSDLAGCIRNALDSVADVAIATEAACAVLTENDRNDDLHELAAAIHDTQQVLKFMADTVGAEILAIDLVEGPDRPTQIPSGGQLVRRTRSKRQNFDQERVIGVIKSRLSEHICTGDSDDTPVGVLTASGERVPVIALVDPIVDSMVAFTGAGTKSFTGWRATPAKALGINLSEFSEWSDGAAYISVEGRNPVVRAGEAVLS